MFSSKLVVVALWLGAVLASSTLLSSKWEECADRDLCDCRGSDQTYWDNGCMSCAGANLYYNYVDGTCGGCVGAGDATYCMVCTDYVATTVSIVSGFTNIIPGYLGPTPQACSDGETRNMTVYLCNDGACGGLPTVIGICNTDVQEYFTETF